MDVATLTLLFVFDAEGGLIDRLVHTLRKKMGCKTQECNLSRFTRTALGLQPQWRAFVNELDLPVRYLHREEFRSHYQALQDIELPAAFLCYDDGSLELVIDADKLRACATYEELERLVRQCVAGRNV